MAGVHRMAGTGQVDVEGLGWSDVAGTTKLLRFV